MTQYSDGTITLTGGSNVVTGLGTAFLANVKPGSSLSIAGLRQVLVVNTVQDDLTLIMRTAFKSVTGNIYSGVPYTIFTGIGGFTPILNMPCPTRDDLDSISVINRAFRIIDRELPSSS